MTSSPNEQTGTRASGGSSPRRRSPSAARGPAHPLRVGLVGCGWIAEIAHLPALAVSRRAELVAVCDPDPTRRAWIGQHLPGIPTPELDKLLADDGVDAVVVAVPSARHADVAEAAFAAGKHVYVEKPLAVRMADGRRVVRAWQESGRVGMVGYNFRRSPIAVDAIRVVREGDIGRIQEIQTAFLWAPERIDGWRADPEAGGGALLDLASHHFDLIHALAGEPIRAVRCSLRSVGTAGDSVGVDLTLEGGARAQVLASYRTDAQVNRLELFGDRGSLLVDLLDPLPNPVVRRPGHGARLRRALRAASRLHPRRLMHPPGREPSFGLALDAFFVAAMRGEAAPPTPLDGLHALAVAEAARRSAARDGAAVEVGSVLSAPATGS